MSYFTNNIRSPICIIHILGCEREKMHACMYLISSLLYICLMLSERRKKKNTHKWEKYAGTFSWIVSCWKGWTVHERYLHFGGIEN